jgi:hypothetical protein
MPCQRSQSAAVISWHHSNTLCNVQVVAVECVQHSAAPFLELACSIAGWHVCVGGGGGRQQHSVCDQLHISNAQTLAASSHKHDAARSRVMHDCIRPWGRVMPQDPACEAGIQDA